MSGRCSALWIIAIWRTEHLGQRGHLAAQLKQRIKQCFGDQLNQGIIDKLAGCDIPWTI